MSLPTALPFRLSVPTIMIAIRRSAKSLARTASTHARCLSSIVSSGLKERLIEQIPEKQAAIKVCAFRSHLALRVLIAEQCPRSSGSHSCWLPPALPPAASAELLSPILAVREGGGATAVANRLRCDRLREEQEQEVE